MEKSVGFEFDSYMQEVFQMKEVDVHSYSPLTLAYIGDSIYDLIIISCTRRPACMFRRPPSLS